jgi:hypothetical protein
VLDTAKEPLVKSTFAIVADGVPVSEIKEKRFKEIADCGFTVVLSWHPGTKDFCKHILDLCDIFGLKALIRDARINDELATKPDYEKILDDIVADYSDHPALLGYFIRDEPSANLFPLLGKITRYLLQKDPTHLPYINLPPDIEEPRFLGMETYEAYVKRFIEETKPQVMSWDHYPLLQDGSIRSGYFTNMELLRKFSLAIDVPLWQWILCVPHYFYADPKEADLRWQIYTTLAYGGKGILYFTYWTGYGTTGNAIIDPFGYQTEKYSIARRINLEVKALAPTLLKLKSVGVYHWPLYPAQVPYGTHRLPGNTLVKSIAGGDFVIGEFKDNEGFDYFMIVNNSRTSSVLSEILLDASVDKVVEIEKLSGAEVEVPISRVGDTVRLYRDVFYHSPQWFAPGDGKLFKVYKR